MANLWKKTRIEVGNVSFKQELDSFALLMTIKNCDFLEINQAQTLKSFGIQCDEYLKLNHLSQTSVNLQRETQLKHIALVEIKFDCIKQQNI
ncbi:CLUMA_CG013425, isoform A [Clunio marinus]|uniref:CLUMA_CG013425, isoform A n=1 Tax=Clunio marinus TaxID=568069 RepID=A0A1J1IIT7_9DIPT|nr:CLUMA_CG013425, isoform A [Clunio marinus]